MINPQEIILKIKPLVMGQSPGDIVDGLLAAAASLMQLTSNFTEEDFVKRAREIWQEYEKKN